MPDEKELDPEVVAKIEHHTVELIKAIFAACKEYSDRNPGVVTNEFIMHAATLFTANVIKDCMFDYRLIVPRAVSQANYLVGACSEFAQRMAAENVPPPGATTSGPLTKQ